MALEGLSPSSGFDNESASTEVELSAARLSKLARRRRSGVNLPTPTLELNNGDVAVEVDGDHDWETQAKPTRKTMDFNHNDGLAADSTAGYNVYDSVTSAMDDHQDTWRSVRNRQLQDELYNVQDTITSRMSYGSVMVNYGKMRPNPKRPRKRLDIFRSPDGGNLLAIMYGVILTLLGLAFPLREALQQTWLTSYVEAIFLIYLYGVSFIFILFLEIYLVQTARKHGHKHKADEKKPKIIVRDKISGESRISEEDDANQQTITSANGLSTQSNGRKISTSKSPTIRSNRPIHRISVISPPSLSALNTNGNVPQHKLSSVSAPRHRSTAANPHHKISTVSFPEDVYSTSSSDKVEVFILEPDQDDHPQLPHHTSLYLRFGAVIFGLGNMIYDGLLIKQIQAGTGGCIDNQFVWPHYIHLIYLLAQTYFIFKHAEVHVTVVKPLARVGFMHLLATNACIWIRTLIREILDSFLHHSDELHHVSESHDSYDNSYTNSYNLTSNETDYKTKTPLYETKCDLHEDIMMQAAPYLFPCVLEYSMLAIAIMYSMFADVGSKSTFTKEERELNKNNSLKSNDHDDEALQPSHVHITMINFHKSHRGLFGGVVLIAATCVSTVLFFSYLGSDTHIAEMIYHITMIGLLLSVLMLVILAGIQMRKMKYFRGNGASVDDVLLLSSMAGVILYNVLKIMPVITYLSEKDAYDVMYILSAVESIFAITVAVLQTVFLLDGSHRFTHTKHLYKTKPARGAVICLLLNNIALWLFRTFNMKEVEIEVNIQEEIYGYLAWQLFSHALIPLLIFYHYHASACFAHIWSNSYRSDTIKEKRSEFDMSSMNTSWKETETVVSWMQPLSNQGTVTSIEDLKPDKIIEFKRRGKAPKTPSTSSDIPVEIVESPSCHQLEKLDDNSV